MSLTKRANRQAVINDMAAGTIELVQHISSMLVDGAQCRREKGKDERWHVRDGWIFEGALASIVELIAEILSTAKGIHLIKLLLQVNFTSNRVGLG
jgi:hypothetical protein